MKTLKHDILLSCLLVCFCIGIGNAEEREAYIKSMIGSVSVRKGQSPTWKDGRPNMVLKEKDAIRTFVESQAEVMTSEGSILKLDENTTMEMSTLKDFGGGTQATKVKILNGSILSNVKKLVNTGSSFEFETPTAVASIRGTTLGLDVTGEKTLVKVYEGEVVVKPKGGTTATSVKTNQMITIVKGEKNAKLETMTEKDKGSVVAPETGNAIKQAIDTAAKKDTTKQILADTSSKAKPQADSLRNGKVSDTTKSGAKIDSAAIKAKAALDATAGTLHLTVVTPADYMHVKPGTPVSVTGKTVGSNVKVTVAGQTASMLASGDFKATVNAPLAPGEYDILVEANSPSQSQSVTRKYVVDAQTQLFLQVSSPTDGQKFGTTFITVSGTTAVGADVTASGIKCQVSSNGSFSGKVPIPDEENQVTIEIEATLGNQSQTIVRKVEYQSDLSLVVTSPVNGQIVTTSTVQVTGQVLPASNETELAVEDAKIVLGTNGKFNQMITIPQDEGQIVLEFEAKYQNIVKKETRTITYKKPIDDIKPTIAPLSLPNYSKTKIIPFTVLDRTTDDEITFYRQIDGSRESETGRPNSSFNLTLEEGVHDYIVYAEDLAKNRSVQVGGTVAYVERSFQIQMRKPLGSEIIRLPPSTPLGSSFAPQYTVKFAILNIPDNDRRLVKQVSVTNLATGQVVTQHDILDLEMEFDIDLKRGINRLSVDVKDINDRIFSAKDLIVDVR